MNEKPSVHILYWTFHEMDSFQNEKFQIEKHLCYEFMYCLAN